MEKNSRPIKKGWDEIMNEETKLKILLENLHIKCIFHEDGDRTCNRTEKYKFTNCNGNINECDLPADEV